MPEHTIHTRGRRRWETPLFGRRSGESGKRAENNGLQKTYGNQHVSPFQFSPCSLHKSGVIKCLAKRAEAVCSGEGARKEEVSYLEVFKENGYPRHYVKRALKSKQRAATEQQGQEPTDDRAQPTAGRPDRTDLAVPDDQTTEQPRTTYISIPYVRGTSERIARVLAPHQIRLGYSSKPTLRDKLVKAKDVAPKDLQKVSFTRLFVTVVPLMLARPGVLKARD